MNQDLSQQNLIKILGIEALPDAQKTKIADQTSELVQKRLLVRVIDSLPEEKREGFMSILDSGDEVGLGNFLHHHAPKFNEWLAEEVLKIKEELAGLAKDA
jgi:hypothetical protein